MSTPLAYIRVGSFFYIEKKYAPRGWRGVVYHQKKVFYYRTISFGRVRASSTMKKRTISAQLLATSFASERQTNRHAVTVYIGIR